LDYLLLLLLIQLLLSTPTVVIYYYYYPTFKLTFISSSYEGWKAESTYAISVHSPCSRLCMAVVVKVNTTSCSGRWSQDHSHHSQACYY